ncbi:MAG: hypothetical protein H0T89_34580 [Deltaproteobacteria bacterium]|nr:hypothetical protein [Deltaproteobacteria bacterium]MDQ3296012.1 hypothetical protein [Myxococcota bacterium]
MRFVLLLCFTACARPLPAESNKPAAERKTMPQEQAAPVAASTREPIVAPALSARELIDAAGVATFLEDRELEVAAIDTPAMERWFARPPRSVFVYAERRVEVAEPDETRRIRCTRVQRWDSNVLNELAVVVWQEGRFRTVLELGQSTVDAVDQARESGEWETVSGRHLPMQAIAWDDAHIRYAEGAELHEVACVPALRTVPCGGEQLPGPRGYCVDHELVIRPWRAPTFPHVGPVIPAYHDPIPDVPRGDCAVQCEPSACKEALRVALIPRAPLYAEDAPVLAAFRSQAACRAFASHREKARGKVADGDRSEDGAW